MSDYSRVLKLAEGTGSGGLIERLDATTVHVSWDDAATDELMGTIQVLVENVRKLPVRLTVNATSDAGVLEALRQATDGIDPTRPLGVEAAAAGDIHVHVGRAVPPTAHASAMPDGHGVHLRPAGAPAPAVVSRPTGLGSVLTASVLTAEVFKAAVLTNGHPAATSRPWDFDPVSLGPMSQEVPALPSLDSTTLVGCGAIGTAIARILGMLGAGGSLTAVDPEPFDYPNLMTYSLGDIGSAARGERKTTLVRAALATASVTTWDGDARSYLREVDAGRLPAPRLLLNGLDSIAARHDANRIRSDTAIDASTGGAVGTTIGLVKALHHGPCLRCYYPHAQAPLRSLADVTGMPAQLLADGDHIITEADIELARPEMRQGLRAHAGTRVCALPVLLGVVPDAGAYRPSAAFVAQQAAALAVGALIRTMTGAEGPDGYEIEYDALYGWKADAIMPRRASVGCECQTQADFIRSVRAVRFGDRDG
jgi:hypothetical protein